MAIVHEIFLFDYIAFLRGVVADLERFERQSEAPQDYFDWLFESGPIVKRLAADQGGWDQWALCNELQEEREHNGDQIAVVLPFILYRYMTPGRDGDWGFDTEYQALIQAGSLSAKRLIYGRPFAELADLGSRSFELPERVSEHIRDLRLIAHCYNFGWLSLDDVVQLSSEPDTANLLHGIGDKNLGLYVVRCG